MKRIYPKKLLLIGMFPLIAFSFIVVIYLIVSGVLNATGMLPLNTELMLSYHILTICLPMGIVTGLLYGIRRRIVIRKDEVLLCTKYSSIKRKRIKMGDIIEICANEIDANDASAKFHIHLKDENLKITEFWYDVDDMLALAKEIKVNNPDLKMNKKLEALLA